MAGIGPAPLQGETFDADITELTAQLQQATNDDQRASLYSRRGSALNLSGRRDESIRDHTKALQLNPKLVDAYVGRGMAFEQKGEPEKAAHDFTMAIRLNPQKWEPYYLRGLAWMDKQQWDRAIPDFDKAIRYNPQHADSFRQRAKCYLWKKNLDQALQGYTAAIAVDPTDFTAHSARGRIYALKGEWKKAAENDTVAIENLRVPMKMYQKFLPPSLLAEVYQDRATAYANQNELDKAAKDYDAAIGLSPNAVDPYLGRATIFGKKKNYPRQWRDLGKAVQLKSPHPEIALNSLAWFRATCPEAEMRNGKEAITLSLRACALSKWKDLHCIDTLAAAYAEANQFEDAVKYQIKAIDLMSAKDRHRAEARRRLDLYRHHKPCRQEF